MLAQAAFSASADAFPDFAAVVTRPVPMGFVRMMRSPPWRVLFSHTLRGCTSPVTA